MDTSIVSANLNMIEIKVAQSVGFYMLKFKKKC